MDSKEIKEPLTEDTVIGSRKIMAAEFRKFFKKMLGEDYEKYPLVMSVIKASAEHKGKTLKEIIEECFNPSGQKNLEEMLSESRFNDVSEPEKAFIIAFDKAMNEMGYDFGDAISMTIKYGKTGTKSRPCPAHIEIGESGTQLRLFLTEINIHQQYIEAAPSHIKAGFVFESGDCTLCNKNFCTGKKYTIDGWQYHKCYHNTFRFANPSMEKLPDYMALLAEFYSKKK